MNVLPSNNNISFSGVIPNWLRLPNSGVRVFRPVRFENDVFGPLTLGFKPEDTSGHEFKILLLNSLKKVLGSEEIKILPEQKILMGKYIEVDPEYRKGLRKRGHNFGELLRLSSIMAMMKNNLDSINIFSKGSAVFFHSKYKFEPDMSDYFERDAMLKFVSNEKSEKFQDLAKRASDILAESKNSGNTHVGRELTNKANELMKEYIQRAMQKSNPERHHRLTVGMDMKLSRENVLRNRDYFNALYKKHGIDFIV